MSTLMRRTPFVLLLVVASLVNVATARSSGTAAYSVLVNETTVDAPADMSKLSVAGTT